MPVRRRFHWGFVVLAAVAVVALVAWVIFHKKPAKAAPPPRVPVTVVKAGVEDVPVSISALGAAQAWQSDTILAQVTGTLLRVNFVEGTDVRAGQVLAEVDPAPYRAALTQAQGALKRDQALLAGARIDLARYELLLRQDSIARQMVDDQVALVNQDEGTVLLDEGNVAAAQVNLKRCTITSPISGRAGVRLVDPGNLVSGGGSISSTPNTSSATSAAAPASSGTSSSTPSSGSAASSASSGGTGIVIINQIQPIAVTFTVPQGDFQRLSDLSDNFRKPLATVATSQETGAQLGNGELSIADNRVDATTGSLELKARFENPGRRLWPGQFVNVTLTLQTLSHVTTIPATAVNQGPNGAFAFVVGPGAKAVMRPIKVAWTEGSTAVIQTGVQPGDVVVTDGQMTLKAGSLVRIVKPAVPGRPAS
jgi:multidrug efflux system membrane fusion protein